MKHFFLPVVILMSAIFSVAPIRIGPKPRFSLASETFPATQSPATAKQQSQLRFQHYFIDKNLEGDAWGQTSLTDVDRDGDLDFVLGRRGGVIVWYEFRDAGTWRRHRIADRSPSDVGGAMLDLNGDGWPDMVAGGAWYENPQKRISGPWTKHTFDPDLRNVHDLITADLDGDRILDIVTMAGGMDGVTRSSATDLRWYKIPSDPRTPWKMTHIGDSVHSGIAAADLDGDGDIDLVRSNLWLENTGRGQTWTPHEIVGVRWHLASQIRVADLNRDGRPDVVLTEGEIQGARLAWFEAPPDPKVEPWIMHLLRASDSKPRGPYHSLAVADFDNDGDLDIFAGEMELLGRSPYRWFIWENTRGDGSEFIERVVLDRGLGTHEAVIGDVDGDGDIDIAGKLWRPVPDNSNGGSNHADYLENLSVQSRSRQEKR